MAQLRQIFPAVPRRTRVLFYNMLVLPHLDYCSCVWHTCGVNLQMKLERIQNYAIRLVTSAKPRTSSAQLRSELSWMTLQDRREMQVVSKVHSCLHGRDPAYLCSKFSRNLNAEHREASLIISNYNALTQIFMESLLSLMGLTYGTNFPGLSSQSGLMKHLGRLFRSICFILYITYHSTVLFWCFVLTHLFCFVSWNLCSVN